MEENGAPEKAYKRLMFVTGRLAAPWLSDYLKDVATRLDFDYLVAALDIDVAAFMTARYIADRLVLTDEQRTTLDALIVPGFAGGDLTVIEAVTGLKTFRGPNDLAELDFFLAALTHADNPSHHSIYYSEEQLRAMQSRLTDPNIRIYTDGERIFAFNNAVFAVGGTDERELRNLFRQLKIDNPNHAFYLGREFYKAALAIRLGKPYKQDRDLEF